MDHIVRLRHTSKCFNKIYNFAIISPWVKGMTLHLNKLGFPSPKNDLCQVWLKLACVSGEEDENVKSL